MRLGSTFPFKVERKLTAALLSSTLWWGIFQTTRKAGAFPLITSVKSQGVETSVS